jgi:hypothetical protein
MKFQQHFFGIKRGRIIGTAGFFGILVRKTGWQFWQRTGITQIDHVVFGMNQMTQLPFYVIATLGWPMHHLCIGQIAEIGS